MINSLIMDRGFKILLVGLPESGKSSIIQAVFEGIRSEQTKKQCDDIFAEGRKISFLGNSINIFDVGEGVTIFDEIFSILQVMAFSNIKAIVYVVDSVNRQEFKKAKYYFQKCYDKVRDHRIETRFFILAHKMDLLADNQKDVILSELWEYFEVEKDPFIQLFGTSICDDSIYDTIKYIVES